MPVLALPALRGLFLFYPDGTLTIEVEASMDEWEIIPGLVEFRNIYVLVNVAPFTPLGNFSFPDMRVAASFDAFPSVSTRWVTAATRSSTNAASAGVNAPLSPKASAADSTAVLAA